MAKKALFCFVFALLMSQQIFATAKFPFPQDQDYTNHNAIKPAGADHNAVQAAYNVWLNNYYEENSSVARIKWDTPALTVSEGIGYGMLIMVYMDNATNNTQGKFDKLWQCYQNNLDINGLMNWKINGFSGIYGDGQNGATDGDLDVAFALALAYYQWGDAKYKNASTGLLAKIWAKEVDQSNKYLFPGDAFTYPINPSYFITAGMGLFGKNSFDSHDWASIKTGCYTFLKKAANPTTGLVADWCTLTGAGDNSRVPPNYTFDAARTPWRMAMAYCWYGDADAKTIAGNMTTWIKGNTSGDPSKIMDGYSLSGTPTGTKVNIPTFLGPFACAAMVDASHQVWLNACYDRLCTFIDNDNYYNQCLKVLSLLLLTGNAPDMSTASPKTAFKITTSVSPASAGSITVSPVKPTYAKGDQVTITAVASGQNKFVKWGGDLTATTAAQTVAISQDMNITAYFNGGSSDLIDDCEDGDNLTNLGGKWFTYNDLSDKGLSTVTPMTSETVLFTMTDGGANSSKKAAKIAYTLNKGTNPYNPYAGFGFWLKKYSPPDTTMDISAASGLTFYFKGDSCDVRVETTDITDFAYFKVRIPKSVDWTLVTLKWSDMKQASWTKLPKTLNLKIATKIAWQSPDNFVTGNSGVIWVDDIHLPGFVVPTTATHETPSLQRHAEKGLSVSLDNAKSMTLRYSMSTPGAVEIALFDLSGKLVKQLFSGSHGAGNVTQSVNVPEMGNARGTYLVQLKTVTGSASSKVVLVK